MTLGNDYIKLWTDFVDKMPSAREVLAGQIANGAIAHGTDNNVSTIATSAIQVADAILAITRPKKDAP